MFHVASTTVLTPSPKEPNFLPHGNANSLNIEFQLHFCFLSFNNLIGDICLELQNKNCICPHYLLCFIEILRPFNSSNYCWVFTGIVSFGYGKKMQFCTSSPEKPHWASEAAFPFSLQSGERQSGLSSTVCVWRTSLPVLLSCLSPHTPQLRLQQSDRCIHRIRMHRQCCKLLPAYLYEQDADTAKENRITPFLPHFCSSASCSTAHYCKRD